MNRQRLVALSAALTLTSVVLAADDAEAQRRRRNRRRNTDTEQSSGSSSSSETPSDATSSSNTTTSSSQSSSSDGWGSSNASAQSANASNASSSNAVDPGPAEPPAPQAPRPAAIDASLGARWYGRFFSYHQDVFGELRGYDLAAAPSLNASVEWYPGAHFSRGVASWFGIVAQGAFVLGVSSRDSRSMTYGTTALSFDVGLRFRVPIGLHDIGLHATYGQQHFTIENNGGGGPGMQDPGVPGVQYQSIRVGASVRIGAGERVGILLGASGLPLLAAGDIGRNYFVRATAAGVEATLGVAIGLVAGLELRVLADARRYFYSMNPMVGDTWVAGGALDHHLSAGAAIAYRR
ncbi:MAG: hypothetical protein JNK05_41045 [Myxococcales bacterium]|nr:hypothetical protein [Myxococcales bacterium]